MRYTCGGNRYNTDKCVVVATWDHRSHSNNYCGTTYIGQAKDGAWLEWTITNGQDLYLQDYARIISKDKAISLLDGADMTPEQEREAVKRGLITIV